MDDKDPLPARTPTSHERMSGRPWDASYTDGPAPWDLGRPQQAVGRLIAEGAFSGPVLDAGCGTGDNAVAIAASGVPVLGVDVAPSAIVIARRKARERGVEAEFVEADGLELGRLGRSFRDVLDSGLLHTFDADERIRYVAGLRSVTRPGATLHVLAFSDEGADLGPHPVSRADLASAFAGGWDVVSIVPEIAETRFHDHGAPAWLATARRV